MVCEMVDPPQPLEMSIIGLPTWARLPFGASRGTPERLAAASAALSLDCKEDMEG